MILMNCNDEDRNFNIPFKQYHNNDYYIKNDSPYLNHLNTYLFSLKSPKYSQPTPLHSLIQTTPKAQIESVVLNIYQNIIEKNIPVSYTHLPVLLSNVLKLILINRLSSI